MSNKIRKKIVLLYSYMSKILILVFSYINMIFIHTKTQRNKQEYDNRILVVAVGPLGDSVLFMDAFREIVSYYENLNCIVTLLCSKNVKRLYENIIVDKSSNIITIEIKWGNWTDFNEFRRVIKEVQGFHYKKSINVSVLWLGDMLTACVHSKEYTKMNYKYCIKQNSIKYLINFLYTDMIECPDTLFMGKCYSMLLHRLGDVKYLSEKPQLRIKKKVINEKYIIVAPIAGTSSRNLSTSQAINIIQYLLKVTNYYVYIIGNKSDANYIKCIMSKCAHERVIDKMGKTGFDDFVYLVGGAKFLIGTDSGHIHVAAMMNTPSIALVGKQDLGKFLPYDYDRNGENEPICIYSKKHYPCQNCIKTYQQRKMNSKCYQRIRKDKNSLCLAEIDMQDVYHAINNILDMM